VKEIIQNADDAMATEVTIAWHPGLGADSKWHPLLNGPALSLINNAAFEERHADAICRMGLGSKAGEDHAIGKFGLGISRGKARIRGLLRELCHNPRLQSNFPQRLPACKPLKKLVSRAGLEPATLCLKDHNKRTVKTH